MKQKEKRRSFPFGVPMPPTGAVDGVRSMKNSSCQAGQNVPADLNSENTGSGLFIAGGQAAVICL